MKKSKGTMWDVSCCRREIVTKQQQIATKQRQQQQRKMPLTSPVSRVCFPLPPWPVNHDFSALSRSTNQPLHQPSTLKRPILELRPICLLSSSSWENCRRSSGTHTPPACPPASVALSERREEAAALKWTVSFSTQSLHTWFWVQNLQHIWYDGRTK